MVLIELSSGCGHRNRIPHRDGRVTTSTKIVEKLFQVYDVVGATGKHVVQLRNGIHV